jgi:hypothetical protein
LVCGVILDLQDVLDEVVAIWVLDEAGNLVDDHFSQLNLLSVESLLEASLHNAAALLVGANLNGPVAASSENELSVLSEKLATWFVGVGWHIRGSEAHEEGLHDVVSVVVGAEEEHLLLKLSDQDQELVVELLVVVCQVFDQCLHSAGAMLVD